MLYDFPDSGQTLEIHPPGGRCQAEIHSGNGHVTARLGSGRVIVHPRSGEVTINVEHAGSGRIIVHEGAQVVLDGEEISP